MLKPGQASSQAGGWGAGEKVINSLGAFPPGPSPKPLGETEGKPKRGGEVQEKVNGYQTALLPYGSGEDRGDKWGAPIPPPRRKSKRLGSL